MTAISVVHTGTIKNKKAVQCPTVDSIVSASVAPQMFELFRRRKVARLFMHFSNYTFQERLTTFAMAAK